MKDLQNLDRDNLIALLINQNIERFIEKISQYDLSQNFTKNKTYFQTISDILYGPVYSLNFTDKTKNLIQVILNHTKNLDLKNSDGRMVLNSIIQDFVIEEDNQKYEFVKYFVEQLIKKGADPRLPDNYGRSAIDYIFLKKQKFSDLYQIIKSSELITKEEHENIKSRELIMENYPFVFKLLQPNAEAIGITKKDPIIFTYALLTPKGGKFETIELPNTIIKAGYPTENEHESVIEALNAWEKVANIKFIPMQSGKDPDIIFVFCHYFLSLNPTIGGISFDKFIFINRLFTVFNTQKHFILMHEIGHQLFLKDNPGYFPVVAPQEPILEKGEANWDNTITAYESNWLDFRFNYPLSPMPFDILAMQLIFGKKEIVEEATYQFICGDEETLQTIYAYSEIDASNCHQNAVINLDSKQEFISHIGSNYFYIGYDNKITKLITGSGNDIIYDGRGELKTGAGNDHIYLAAGDAYIDSGLGNDFIHLHPETNTIIFENFDSSKDTIILSNSEFCQHSITRSMKCNNNGCDIIINIGSTCNLPDKTILFKNLEDDYSIKIIDSISYLNQAIIFFYSPLQIPPIYVAIASILFAIYENKFSGFYSDFLKELSSLFNLDNQYNQAIQEDTGIKIIQMASRMILRGLTPLPFCIAYDFTRGIINEKNKLQKKYSSQPKDWKYFLHIAFIPSIASFQIGSIYLVKPLANMVMSCINGFMIDFDKEFSEKHRQPFLSRMNSSFWAGGNTFFRKLVQSIPGGEITLNNYQKKLNKSEQVSKNFMV